MTKTKKKSRKFPDAKPVSIPLDFEDALAKILEVKPPPEKKRKAKKKSSKD